MMQVQFTVPGQPVAKARARVTMVGGFARAYTPKKTADYEKFVAEIALICMNWQKPTDRAVEVRMEFHMQIPPSWSKKKQALALAGIVRATKKSDIDNMAKGILDGCNGVVFVDDSQIVAMSLRKLYSADPRVIVAVRSLEGEPA